MTAVRSALCSSRIRENPRSLDQGITHRQQSGNRTAIASTILSPCPLLGIAPGYNLPDGYADDQSRIVDGDRTGTRPTLIESIELPEQPEGPQTDILPLRVRDPAQHLREANYPMLRITDSVRRWLTVAKKVSIYLALGVLGVFLASHLLIVAQALEDMNDDSPERIHVVSRDPLVFANFRGNVRALVMRYGPIATEEGDTMWITVGTMSRGKKTSFTATRFSRHTGTRTYESMAELAPDIPQPVHESVMHWVSKADSIYGSVTP